MVAMIRMEIPLSCPNSASMGSLIDSGSSFECSSTQSLNQPIESTSSKSS